AGPGGEQEPGRCRSPGQWAGGRPGLLGCPVAVGVPGATCEMDTPAAELEEEEHIEAPEPERLDSEEVAGDDRVGVGTQEVAPAELGANAGRRHAGLPQDLGDRRCRDAHADAGEFTDDPLVAPARVLMREPQHELTNLLRHCGPAGSP